MSRRYVVVALLALGLAACPTQSPSVHFSPTGNRINANRNLTFTPSTMTIKLDDTVIWDNSSGIDHKIKFENGLTFEQPLPNRLEISRRFTLPGTFNYY